MKLNRFPKRVLNSGYFVRDPPISLGNSKKPPIPVRSTRDLDRALIPNGWSGCSKYITISHTISKPTEASRTSSQRPAESSENKIKKTKQKQTKPSPPGANPRLPITRCYKEPPNRTARYSRTGDRPPTIQQKNSARNYIAPSRSVRGRCNTLPNPAP